MSTRAWAATFGFATAMGAVFSVVGFVTSSGDDETVRFLYVGSFAAAVVAGSLIVSLLERGRVAQAELKVRRGTYEAFLRNAERWLSVISGEMRREGSRDDPDAWLRLQKEAARHYAAAENDMHRLQSVGALEDVAALSSVLSRLRAIIDRGPLRWPDYPR